MELTGGTQRRSILSAGAPAPVAAYSQAISAGGILYSAGQVGLDPGTGQLVEGGIDEQARRVFANLAAVLEAADAGFGDVVAVSVFLVRAEDFAPFNNIYAAYFDVASPPARTTVVVAALPLGALVEVSLVAHPQS